MRCYDNENSFILSKHRAMTNTGLLLSLFKKHIETQIKLFIGYGE